MNGNESIAKMEEAIEKAKDLLNTRVKVTDMIKESPETLAMIGISPLGGLVDSFSQLYFTINLEEIFYFNNKKMPYLCGF